MLRLNDDLAKRLIARAVSQNAMILLQCKVNDLALMAVHRLQDDALVRAAAALRQARCQTVKRLLAALAVIFNIEDDAHALLRQALIRGKIHEILQGVERLPVLADQDAEKMQTLIDALEDNDDVQNVYSNYEMDE